MHWQTIAISLLSVAWIGCSVEVEAEQPEPETEDARAKIALDQSFDFHGTTKSVGSYFMKDIDYDLNVPVDTNVAWQLTKFESDCMKGTDLMVALKTDATSSEVITDSLRAGDHVVAIMATTLTECAFAGTGTLKTVTDEAAAPEE